MDSCAQQTEKSNSRIMLLKAEFQKAGVGNSAIDRIIDLRAVQMGTKQLLVLARVSMRDDIPAGQAERLLAGLRRRLQHEHPEVMDSYVELNPS